jgi:hypothetical protein
MVMVILIALVFWVGVIMAIFSAQGITPAEFIRGRYEPPPGDLGIWKEFGVDEQSHLRREERYLLPRDDAKSGQLLHQVRYRDRVTRVIVRVEPDRRIRRRRGSVRGFR